MFNHEPVGYQCPFCMVLSGGEDTMTSQQDIVLRTERAMAFVASRWWPNNRGHVLVVPTEHHENLYDLPALDGHAVQDAVREVAIGIRHTYGCDGISTRQHNEPAGYQDAWHYHVHVFPRYDGDNLYNTRHLSRPATPEEREPYARRLRAYFTAEAIHGKSASRTGA
jgi:histidine triad (HIT) family protein